MCTHAWHLMVWIMPSFDPITQDHGITHFYPLTLTIKCLFVGLSTHPNSLHVGCIITSESSVTPLENFLQKCNMGYTLYVIAKSWGLKDHPGWMFRKNSMEFFVGLLDYLYKFYRGYATTNPRSHVLLEYSTITWPCHMIWLPKFPCYL